MRQQRFEALNAARWDAFEERVEALERLGRRRARGEEADALVDFPERYREVCRDLAVATERRYGPRLLDRLNRLTLDGHRVLYTRDPSFLGRIVGFVAVEFPRRLRADFRAVGLAATLFLAPGLIVWALVAIHPELVYSVLSPDQVREFEAMYDPASEHLGRERASDDDLAMFGFYVFNNVGIAFRAYAGGLLLGLGSAAVLVLNGVLLGAVAAHLGELGFERTFYSFVIGHGAFELTAIVISGAAGLRLGAALIAPGAGTRLAALRRAAQASVGLIQGAFGMLLVAAVIEAFWSSSARVPAEVKLVVGGLLWIAVLAHLGLAGRGLDRTGTGGGRGGSSGGRGGRGGRGDGLAERNAGVAGREAGARAA